MSIEVECGVCGAEFDARTGICPACDESGRPVEAVVPPGSGDVTVVTEAKSAFAVGVAKPTAADLEQAMDLFEVVSSIAKGNHPSLDRSFDQQVFRDLLDLWRSIKAVDSVSIMRVVYAMAVVMDSGLVDEQSEVFRLRHPKSGVDVQPGRVAVDELEALGVKSQEGRSEGGEDWVYLQDKTRTGGDSVCWVKAFHKEVGALIVTRNVSEARVFTEAEAAAMQAAHSEKFRVWPKDLVEHTATLRVPVWQGVEYGRSVDEERAQESSHPMEPEPPSGEPYAAGSRCSTCGDGDEGLDIGEVVRLVRRRYQVEDFTLVCEGCQAEQQLEDAGAEFPCAEGCFNASGGALESHPWIFLITEAAAALGLEGVAAEPQRPSSITSGPLHPLGDEGEALVAQLAAFFVEQPEYMATTLGEAPPTVEACIRLALFNEPTEMRCAETGREQGSVLILHEGEAEPREIRCFWTLMVPFRVRLPDGSYGRILPAYTPVHPDLLMHPEPAALQEILMTVQILHDHAVARGHLRVLSEPLAHAIEGAVKAGADGSVSKLVPAIAELSAQYSRTPGSKGKAG